MNVKEILAVIDTTYAAVSWFSKKTASMASCHAIDSRRGICSALFGHSRRLRSDEGLTLETSAF